MVSYSAFLLAVSTITGVLAAPTDTSPNFALERYSDLVPRQSYSTDYKTGGTVNYVSGSGGEYKVTFSEAQDFVVGKGWATGSARDITFSGSFAPTSGTVLLSVYGWTKNPLIEYYIVEDYTTAPTGSLKGTITSDGATYNVYETTRTNEPSIVGTATFHQFISVRTSKRSSGTVTTANHFNGWAKLGLTLGTTWAEQVVATEGYGDASGSSTITVS
ncbi:hypothetical protein G7Y89_g3309 [Cudoniella acicularis]|uniref:Endo-1,4-beta-xylanase n=1 Tax=Cudoniella acicularis TaxID=354080 RepID=A0A8H4RSF7_9HELO|nr:hypothetical protein G7Y89_g3309 [Cudoniella acicularis]